MRLLRLAVLLVPLALAACSTSTEPDFDYVTVGSSGVSSFVYDKMMHGERLEIRDIVALHRANVSDEIIIQYLSSVKSVYHLTAENISTLHVAGLSRDLVAFMLETPRRFTRYNVAAGSGLYIPFYDDYIASPPYNYYPESSRN